MKVSNLTPCEKISHYVDRVLVIEDVLVTNPFTLPLYANGAPTLLFQTAKGIIKNNSNNLTLFGQTVFPETLTIRDNFTLIAYFFKPFALFALFGVSAQELTNNPIDLNLLAPSKTQQLQEQLLNAATTEEMIGLLNDYIFSLITKTTVDSQIIRFATLTIAQNAGKDALLKVQKELHVTERTFQRMFEKNIGIAPNLYRRIWQFNNAFQQLNNRQFVKLSDIAFANGYADQSHYIRAFKEFTGITPKDYLKFGQSE
ncbi:helix-turn-helix domain-containing protein [Niastella sp. OAS944]|uniref:helix-turn-helix domain-containing protein n=1 Tax=Niastella sp. OAS944 TaxID=2664089 RepID=UPI00346CDCF7|nr:AraC-like DNA-binding protein [Chitinophagaceae bacterium OAS944]